MLSHIPRLHRRPLAALVQALAFSLALPALAQNLRLDIPAQPLATALDQFARQAGLQLVFSPALAQGRQAPALSGERDLRQALDELLRGSGLDGRVENGTLTIRPGRHQQQEPGRGPRRGAPRRRRHDRGHRQLHQPRDQHCLQD